jgi:hypothetical protein
MLSSVTLSAMNPITEIAADKQSDGTARQQKWKRLLIRQ